MKKLLLVLLVVTLASFLLVGCFGTTPPPDDGGGGGVVVSEVKVDIAGAVKVGNYTYVSKGNHTITVTFPAPVAGVVTANITACTGDYTKAFTAGGSPVVLFPDATKKIWTGSGSFSIKTTQPASYCCASYVEVSSGECAELVCIAFPVIVDGDKPYSTVKVSSKACPCPGCAVTFESFTTVGDCADVVNCGDDCSGLTSWAFNVYNTDPFNKCCLTPCATPVHTCSGTACPILCTTSCLAGPTAAQLVESSSAVATYYVVETLADAVGNTKKYYAIITLDSSCVVTVQEHGANLDADADGIFDCTTFDSTSVITNANILKK